jgi:hypothetical protein
MADTGLPLPLMDAARLIGHYRWVEARLFETMGGWAATVPEPEPKVRLSDDSLHHAWHAELWWDRLPELHDVDPGDFTVPATAGVEAFMAALARPAGTIERLVGVYRVLLPRKVAAYSAHLELASRGTDGPTIRALRLVLADERADWQHGERMIQRLLETSADVAQAARHQAQLEALLVAAGGIAGAGTGAVVSLHPPPG